MFNITYSKLKISSLTKKQDVQLLHSFKQHLTEKKVFIIFKTKLFLCFIDRIGAIERLLYGVSEYIAFV